MYHFNDLQVPSYVARYGFLEICEDDGEAQPGASGSRKDAYARLER